MNKQEARKEGLKNRASLSEKERAEKSRQITEKILPMLEGQALVGCYVSMRDEVSTKEIIGYCLDRQIPVAVPKVKGKTLFFLRITDRTQWETGDFGVCEPLYGETVKPEDISLMIVPLSAFDDSGNRTGYGKGYYDSVLERCGRKIGIAFSAQKCGSIDPDPWDVRLDQVITE